MTAPRPVHRPSPCPPPRPQRAPLPAPEPAPLPAPTDRRERLPGRRPGVVPALLLPLLLGLGGEPAPASAAPVAPAGAPAAPRQDDDRRLRELLRQVLQEGDDASPQLFQEMVAIGGEGAFDTWSTALDELRDPRPLRNAYQAARGFRGTPQAPEAIELLAKDALRHRRDPNRLEAARALASWGPGAEAQLEQVVRRSKEAEVRALAIEPLFGVLRERGDGESVELLLENVRLDARNRGAVQQALLPARGSKTLRAFDDVLTDEESAPALRRLLVEVLGTWDDPGAHDLVAAVLKDPDPELRSIAIEILGRSGDERYARKIESHLKSNSGPEVREAVIALSRLSRGDPRFLSEVIRLAHDRDPAARMGAAVALLEIRTEDALVELHHLLEDTDWRVRAEAVAQVGRLHRIGSVPLLIDRLDVETERLRQDVATVLRLMTGQDHGEHSTRWRAWWTAEGDSFRLPTPEEAEKLERERQERRANNTTRASFYGLEVVSDRVAFVLDHSGSMNAPAGGEGRSRSDRSQGPTRLDVAKQELSKALQSLDPGVLFNLIFFETRVSPWKDELLPMDEDALAAALQFVGEKDPGGGTNIFDSLMAAFEDERVDTIYLLSDGDPSAGSVLDREEIRTRIARLNRTRKVVIHCISIGKGSPFLRALADENGGRYTEAL